jgi:O-antigen/teichoic acid export membrane protein
MTLDQQSPSSYHIKKIITNILAHTSGSTISYGITAIALILIARQLGPSQYGQYSSSFLWSNIAAILFNLGLDMWLLREGGKRPEDIGVLSGSILAIKIILGFFWVLLMVSIAPLIRASAFPTTILRLSAVAVWLNSIFLTTLVPFRSLLKNKISSLLDSLTSIAWFLMVLALLWLDETRIDQYATAFVFYTLLKTGVGLLIFKRSIKPSIKFSIIRSAIREIPPYAASDFLALAFMRLDLIMVAMILGDTAAGFYAPAAGILHALFIFPSAIHIVIVPILSHLFVSNRDMAWKYSKHTVQALGGLGIFLFCITWFGSQYLTLFLGSIYQTSGELLKWLATVILLHSITYGLASILVATNQQTKRSIVQAIAVSINILSNLVLAPRIGLVGVVVAYMISEIVLLLGYMTIVAITRYGSEQWKTPIEI